MTIQRQYSLPNCSLMLEGLSTNGDSSMGPMAVLLNVECHLPGAAAGPLTGGREFLEQLVAAVSAYAQRLLSGVPHPLSKTEPPLVELKPGDGPYHHLIVRSDKPTQGTGQAEDTSVTAPLDIKLSTVQFFDLMEAVDQLLADAQTLPDLTLNLSPVPRRFVKPAEPIAKRAAPAVLGASALAAAGLALFFVPPPTFEPNRTSDPESSLTEPDEGSSATAAASSPAPQTATAAANAATAPDPEAQRIENAPVINDPQTVEQLRQGLNDELNEQWSADPLPTEDWRYEVAVAENGDILGYKSLGEVAQANHESTPLLNLVFSAPSPTEPVDEPVARFIARFTPAGEVVVEPFEANAVGGPGAAIAATPPDGGELENPIANRIRDRALILSLNSELSRRIKAAPRPDSFDSDLTYRVRVNEAGDIVGYEAEDSASQTALAQTPLPNLLASSADDEASLIDYKVVFTEDSIVEVNPWDGWPK
ncbi:MAG TPA: DUF4335 domain-containing protein [Trichocoleus sp.]